MRSSHHGDGGLCRGSAGVTGNDACPEQRVRIIQTTRQPWCFSGSWEIRGRRSAKPHSSLYDMVQQGGEYTYNPKWSYTYAHMFTCTYMSRVICIHISLNEPAKLNVVFQNGTTNCTDFLPCIVNEKRFCPFCVLYLMEWKVWHRTWKQYFTRLAKPRMRMKACREQVLRNPEMEEPKGALTGPFHFLQQWLAWWLKNI